MLFHNQGSLYEVYARKVSQGNLLGFVEKDSGVLVWLRADIKTIEKRIIEDSYNFV